MDSCVRLRWQFNKPGLMIILKENRIFRGTFYYLLVVFSSVKPWNPTCEVHVPSLLSYPWDKRSLNIKFKCSVWTYHFLVGTDFFPNGERKSRTLHWSFENLTGRSPHRNKLNPRNSVRCIRHDCYTKYNPRNSVRHIRTGDLHDLWFQSIHPPIGGYFWGLWFRVHSKDQPLWVTCFSV